MSITSMVSGPWFRYVVAVLVGIVVLHLCVVAMAHAGVVTVTPYGNLRRAS